MPNFNIPDPNDPNFADKFVQLMKDLFEQNEAKVKNFPPITNPEEGLQIGSVYFDEQTQTLKCNTSTGVRTISFDP